MTTKWELPPAVAGLPVCPVRKLPIPYIAEIGDDGVGHFTILDDRRARECLAGRLCAMCGEPMGAEVALLGDRVSLKPGAFFIEPPVHESCGEAAAGGLCPFMAGQRVPRRMPDMGVALIGATPDQLTDIGRTVPKRAWAMAITRDYQAAMTPSTVGSPVMVYLAGKIERVRLFDYGPDGRLAEVVKRPPVPVARVQPRRTTRAQRRRR